MLEFVFLLGGIDMAPSNKHRMGFVPLISLISFFLVANLAFAETKVFVREYTYHVSDEDSKNSSRTIALREVKRLLLEELGTYLESETEVRNFLLTKDQIITLTAGIVKTEIVDEKWDGRTYWLRAKIAADSDGVIKAINTLRQDRVKTKQLEDARRHSDELLRENERLRKELGTATGDKREKDRTAYDETIKSLTATEWFEKGYASYISRDYGDAIDAFSKTIELNPEYSEVYYHRGVAYDSLGNYRQAITDFNKAIELEPKDSWSYHYRGAAYDSLGNYKQAIKDYDKAIELRPNFAVFYTSRGTANDSVGNHKQAITDFNKAIELNPNFAASYTGRGLAYDSLGNHKQAIRDYDKAIELNPKDAIAYNNRGVAYYSFGNHKQAITDFNKAIGLDPNFATAYNNRGDAYKNLGNHEEAIKDYKIAAKLGYKPAQDFLKSEGISW